MCNSNRSPYSRWNYWTVLKNRTLVTCTLSNINIFNAAWAVHVTIFSIGGNSALLRFLHSLHTLTLVAHSYVLLIHTHSHTYPHIYTYIPAPTQTHTHVHTLNTSISHVPSHDIMWTTRISFSFLLKGSKMRLYGGASTYSCAKHVAN